MLWILESVFGLVFDGAIGWLVHVVMWLFSLVICATFFFVMIVLAVMYVPKLYRWATEEVGAKLSEPTRLQETAFVASQVAVVAPVAPGPIVLPAQTNGLTAETLLSGINRNSKVIESDQTVAFSDGRKVNQKYQVTEIQTGQPSTPPQPTPAAQAAPSLFQSVQLQ